MSCPASRSSDRLRVTVQLELRVANSGSLTWARRTASCEANRQIGKVAPLQRAAKQKYDYNAPICSCIVTYVPRDPWLTAIEMLRMISCLWPADSSMRRQPAPHCRR